MKSDQAPLADRKPLSLQDAGIDALNFLRTEVRDGVGPYLRAAFGVWRSPFTVWRLAFTVRRSVRRENRLGLLRIRKEQRCTKQTLNVLPFERPPNAKR